MKKLFIILITFIPVSAFLCGQTILPKEKEGSIIGSNLGNTSGSISPFNISKNGFVLPLAYGLVVYLISIRKKIGNYEIYSQAKAIILSVSHNDLCVNIFLTN
jgi:hypothetical protein